MTAAKLKLAGGGLVRRSDVGQQWSHLSIALAVGFACLSWNIDFAWYGNLGAILGWVGIAFVWAIAFFFLPRRNEIAARKIFPILLLVLSLLLSEVTSIDQYRTAVEIARVATFALLFPIVLKSDPQERRMALEACIVAANFVVVISTIMIILGLKLPGAVAVGAESFESRIRYLGLAPTPGVLGYCAAISLAAAAVKIHSVLRWRVSFSLLMEALLATSAAYTLIMSDSRTGELAVLFVFAAMLGKGHLSHRKSSRGSVSLTKWMTVVAICGAMMVPVVTGALSLDLVGYNASAADLSIIERQLIWHRAFLDFISHPIIGKGFATSLVVLAGADRLGVFIYAHSVLLNYLSGAGIFGGLAVMYVIISSITNAIDALSASGKRGADIVGNGVQTQTVERSVALLIITVCFSLVEGALQGMYSSFVIFFVSTGSLASVTMSARRRL